MLSKRQILKDEVYLKMAKTISKLSKDENTQNGAVIVAKDGTPVSWGYNGTISGFRDEMIPHSREEKHLKFRDGDEEKELKLNKYPFMCHAEENALDFGLNIKLLGSTIYVTGMPCGSCARQIAKKKIARVVICPDYLKGEESTMGKEDDLAKFFFVESGIELYLGTKRIEIEHVV